MRSLASLFGASPFAPLQAHMAVVTRCADQIPGLIDKLIAGDEAGLREVHAAVQALESEADSIKDGMRDHLPRRLWIPVARSDLLEVLDLQDTIADLAEDVGDLLTERTWTLTEGIVEPLRALTQLSVQTVAGTNDLLQNLDDVVGSAFTGPEVESFRRLIAHVMELEDQTDALEADLRRAIFAGESELGAVNVILWLNLAELIGDLSDYAKKACNRLRLIIAT